MARLPEGVKKVEYASGEVRFEVRIDADGGRVRIEVTDSGPGVPEEIREKIMQPFFTTRPLGQGTGLGLSIARGLVESAGGRLELESPVAPTRFVIELPRVLTA